MTIHLVCCMLVVMMSQYPVWVHFHQCVHIALLVVHGPSALPSPFCAALVLHLVIASPPPTSSLPLASASPSLFAQSFCFIVASLPQSPKLL